MQKFYNHIQIKYWHSKWREQTKELDLLEEAWNDDNQDFILEQT